MSFDFIRICRLYESVASCPIRSKVGRVKVSKRIKRAHEAGYRVRCFRDNPGYLLVAMRKPRLLDFF